MAVPNNPQPTNDLTIPDVSPFFNFLKKLLVKDPSAENVIAAKGMSATALAPPITVGNGEYSYKNFNELTKNLGKGIARDKVKGTLFTNLTKASPIPPLGSAA